MWRDDTSQTVKHLSGCTKTIKPEGVHSHTHIRQHTGGGEVPGEQRYGRLHQPLHLPRGPNQSVNTRKWRLSSTSSPTASPSTIFLCLFHRENVCERARGGVKKDRSFSTPPSSTVSNIIFFRHHVPEPLSQLQPYLRSWHQKFKYCFNSLNKKNLVLQGLCSACN